MLKSLNETKLANETDQINVFGPKSTSLKRLNELGLLKLVNVFIRLGVQIIGNKEFLNDEGIRNQNKNLIEIKQELIDIFATIKQTLSIFLKEYDISDSTSPLASVTKLLESLSGALECVSFCLIVFIACLSMDYMRPIWTERIKKSKKKKDAFLKYATTIDMIREIYEQFTHIVTYFVWVLRDKLTNASLASKCDTLFAKIEATPKLVQDEKNATTQHFSNISLSYKKSCDDLKRVFISKLKILLKLSAISTDWVEFVDNVKSKF